MSGHRPGVLFGQVDRVHFVGVGGSGMCGLAELLVVRGVAVSGSDLRDGAHMSRLAGLGCRVFVGHHPDQIGDAEVVVVSTAVPPDNPEVAAARQRGMTVIHRAELLGELMRGRYAVAVAGSHGKTTTTAMAGVVLAEAGLDPTVIVGGRVPEFDSHVRPGGGDVLVAETDESDGSFLRLWPCLAVVTNIDDEHLDTYGSVDGLRRAFAEFANQVPFHGRVLLNGDDPGAMAVRPLLRRRCRTFGLGPDTDLRATEIESSATGCAFRVRDRGRDLGGIQLAVPGSHNVSNALAALGIGLELGLQLEAMAPALARFGGADRRFQVIGQVRGVRVIDDYGHHPAEIAATLAAARQGCGGRLLVVFQPHRFSRLEALWDGFRGVFGRAHVVWVTPVYAAGEVPRPGVDGVRFQRDVQTDGHPDARYEGDPEKLAAAVATEARPGDWVITLGAGDVNRIGHRVCALLRQGEQYDDAIG